MSLPFQRYSGTGSDLFLGFGLFGGKPIVGFTEPIIGFTCGSLFELLFGFYLKCYKKKVELNDVIYIKNPLIMVIAKF